VKELWVKKTIWRRYLIEDSDVIAAAEILNGEPERSDEIIIDLYNANESIEYDNEQVVIPVKFEIKEI